LYAKPNVQGNMGGWQERHMEAVKHPRSFEQPMVHAIEAWLQYADEHQTRYESLIGDDGVLGDYWESMGDALRGLLNGECGRLDCGTLDSLILDAMREAGIN